MVIILYSLAANDTRLSPTVSRSNRDRQTLSIRTHLPHSEREKRREREKAGIDSVVSFCKLALKLTRIQRRDCVKLLRPREGNVGGMINAGGLPREITEPLKIECKY